MAFNEETKIGIQHALEEFARDSTRTEYEFEDAFTKTERAFIHRQCQLLGLHSKSRGGNSDRDQRFMVIFKHRRENVIGSGGNDTASIPAVIVNANVMKMVGEFLNEHPVSEDARHALSTFGLFRKGLVPIQSQFSTSFPSVPPPPNVKRIDPGIEATRQNLPVQKHRYEFLERLERSQVMLVLGETGSGKSTQIPQFILDHSTATGQPCRIVVSEPRRIATTNLANRVARERGESVGATVGYQIRLESRLSNQTVLHFCTNGVLLNGIVAVPDFFETVTHVIIDEVHERDKYTDFLLTIMRDKLPMYPKLKLIIMSATLEKELLSNYFTNYRFLEVSGRSYSVVNMFLPDVLLMTNYVTELVKKQRFKRPMELTAPMAEEKRAAIIEQSRPSAILFAGVAGGGECLTHSFDTTLESIWKCNDINMKRALFESTLDEVAKGVIDINCSHVQTGATMLMVAAACGLLDVVDLLLSKGANPDIMAVNGWLALHWALAFGNERCVDRLKNVTTQNPIIEIYHSLVDDEQVDILLVVEQIAHIHTTMPPGAILVFLPGYDDIMLTKEAVFADRRLPHSQVFVCLLHSQMRGREQMKAFDPVFGGKRRVVLSTNLAEVSITLEDVVYVIDTGKMKQRVYDENNDVSAMSTVWISKSNVIQRAGRAGRCRDGLCFHLYTNTRFEAMPQKPIPEILRLPAYELCLQTNLMYPESDSVAAFLQKAPEPPSTSIIDRSVRLLKRIGAFDDNERMTCLGRYLVDLPVDPQIGKMILQGMLLRCLNPVLIIAASLSFGDPFLLPRERSCINIAADRKHQLGKSSTPFSDHGVYVNAMQMWASYTTDAQARFCVTNFLSNSSMKAIMDTRHSLLKTVYKLFNVNQGLDIDTFFDKYNVNGNLWPVVKAALTAGIYPNIGFADRANGKLVTKTERASFHPSSVFVSGCAADRSGRRNRAQALDEVSTDWLLYVEMCRHNQTMQAKSVTAVDSLTLALFAGLCNLSAKDFTSGEVVDRTNEDWDAEGNDGIEIRQVAVLQIDDWLKVRMEPEIALDLINIREKLHMMFLTMLVRVEDLDSDEHKMTLKLIVDLLCTPPEQ